MSAPKIKSIWICPPLAFARFGSSQTPLESYRWAENDYNARGTAETVIEPALTLTVKPAGDLQAYMPSDIQFRDGGHWRPICPFFEVHAEWEGEGESGPLTERDLDALGVGLEKVSWTVEAANRKAYHYTLNEDDLVVANLELRGDDHRRSTVEGRSSSNAKQPLVPPGKTISFGHAQVIRPNERFPELRLRITAPGGHIYAPTNTSERDLASLLPGDQGKERFLAEIRTILNPDATWANWEPKDADTRTNPGGLYAQEPSGKSLGFLDDMNDGRIRFCLELEGRTLEAWARYTCCPPDFQPDRRPFVSIADGLADAVNREEVLDPAFVAGAWEETEAEIADFMQRVRETMEASNLDHQNLRSQLANNDITKQRPAPIPFEPAPPRPGHPLPLTENGRAHHARFLAYDVFKQRIAKQPKTFSDRIRNPTAEPEVYDEKMPALMRGSDSKPMTLTQRQYDLMGEWLKLLRSAPNEPNS